MDPSRIHPHHIFNTTGDVHTFSLVELTMSNVESVITTTVLISSTSRSNFVRSDPILDKSILSAMSLF